MYSDRHLLVACTAAFVATFGDFLLLYVGNSLSAGVRLPSAEFLLGIGGALGCVAMLCYAFGYAVYWPEPCDRAPESRALAYSLVVLPGALLQHSPMA